MTETTNLHLKIYVESDRVNLITGYNSSMRSIDSAYGNMNSAMTTMRQDIDALEGGSFTPSASDAYLTVNGLNNAKVTANGIVYIPQS